MQSLQQIWNQVKGPFKAKKVGLNKEAYKSTVEMLPVGSVAHVIEKKDNDLHGVLVRPNGQEERKVFAAQEEIWERIK